MRAAKGLSVQSLAVWGDLSQLTNSSQSGEWIDWQTGINLDRAVPNKVNSLGDWLKLGGAGVLFLPADSISKVL